MREQVITPRAGRSAASSAGAGRGRSGAVVQRPAKRERGGSGTKTRGAGRLRKVLSLLPLISKVLLAVAAGVLIFAGYRAAASASFFRAQRLDVNGLSRASAEDVRDVVRRNVLQTGVWKADLDAMSAELERLPWVRSAVVTRVLPDGLRVRVTEREQRAVVRTSAGRFIWVDEDAVSLGAMSASDHMPDFFIRGWDESGTSEGRAENRERMQKYMELVREWQEAGLSPRISEVNLGDLRDLRVQLAGDDSQIEVRLGEKDFTNRLRRALKVLDEERHAGRANSITYLLAMDTRTLIGTNSARSSAAETVVEETSADASGATRTVARESASSTGVGAKRDAPSAAKPTAKKKDEQKDKERARREKRNEETRTETRPRRVG